MRLKKQVHDSSARLPFLNECKFKASIVSTTDTKRNRGPKVEILMLTPEPKSEFSLNKLVVAELKILSGSAVLPVQEWCMADPIKKIGLHIGDVGESGIYTGKNSCEKKLWEARVEPQKQNRLQLGIGSETMYDGQHHSTGLRNAKPLEKRDVAKGVKNVQHQYHRMGKVKVGLKDFVLKLLPEKRS